MPPQRRLLRFFRQKDKDSLKMAKNIIIFFLVCIAIFFVFVLANPVSAQIIDNAPADEGNVDLGAPIGGTTTPSSFADYTNRFYQYAVFIGISLAVLMIIFAGYKYMSSAGDPQSLAEAKEILVGAIVGLVLILLTRLILTTIDPRLLQFPERAPELGGSGTTASTDIDKKASQLCRTKKIIISTISWQKGPCLDKNLENSGYAVDIAHDPRQSIDNEAENTCGVSSKFYEFDLDCGLIQKKD